MEYRQNKSAQILCTTFILLSIFFIILPSIADASYTIYLKNGSVIKGIGHYEKAEGEIRVYFGNGMVGIPEKNILKIESSEGPVRELKTNREMEVTKPAEPERVERLKPEVEERPVIRNMPDDIDKKISEKEAELKAIEGDLLRTKVRIQALYSKSLGDALSSGENMMLQQNMAKKRKLEDDKKRIEDELVALRKQKGTIQ
ncbi:MAG: hypothetical protein HY754_15590 [Nitrospirae bacterium]|nr:hypothetical protein [Nitrospirota bacterium]